MAYEIEKKLPGNVYHVDE